MEAEKQERTIAASAQRCLGSFNACLQYHSSIPTRQQVGIEDQLGRFSIWISSINALGPFHASPDYHLRGRNDIQRVVVRSIYAVQEHIEEYLSYIKSLPLGADEPAPENQGSIPEVTLEALLTDVSDEIGLLHRLSGLIRQASSEKHNLEAAISFATKNEVEVDNTSANMYSAMQLIGQIFPICDEVIKKRLAAAVLLRHKRISKQHIQGINDSESDSNRQTETEDPRRYPSESATLLTTIPTKEAWNGRIVTHMLGTGPQAKELSNYKQSKYTQMPRGPILQGETLKSDRDWLNDYMKDLEPYVCLFKECKLPDKPYYDREEWWNHMRQHKLQWRCAARSHGIMIFKSRLEYEEHMITKHKSAKSQIAVLAERSGRPSGPVFESCPFCLAQTDDPWEYHILTHLKYLTIESLQLGDYNSKVLEIERPGAEPIDTNKQDRRTFKDSLAVDKSRLDNKLSNDNFEDSKDDKTQNYSTNFEADAEYTRLVTAEGKTKAVGSAPKSLSERVFEHERVGQRKREVEKFKEHIRLLMLQAKTSDMSTDNVEINATSFRRNHPSSDTEARDYTKQLGAARQTKKAAETETASEVPLRIEEIHFINPYGKDFAIPLNKCRKIEQMTGFLIKNFRDSVIGARVARREYDLVGLDGAIISSQEWEAALQPGMAFTMQMWADSDTVREDIETSNRGKAKTTHGQPKDSGLRGEEPYYDRTSFDKPSIPSRIVTKKGQQKDYYNILEISKDASHLDIRKAFRKLAIKYHPDRNGGATSAVFNEISEAYEVLIDTQKRASYNKDYDLIDHAKKSHRRAPSFTVVPRDMGEMWEVVQRTERKAHSRRRERSVSVERRERPEAYVESIVPHGHAVSSGPVEYGEDAGDLGYINHRKGRMVYVDPYESMEYTRYTEPMGDIRYEWETERRRRASIDADPLSNTTNNDRRSRSRSRFRFRSRSRSRLRSRSRPRQRP